MHVTLNNAMEDENIFILLVFGLAFGLIRLVLAIFKYPEVLKYCNKRKHRKNKSKKSSYNVRYVRDNSNKTWKKIT